MNSKERLLTALRKGKPDRLPATVHQWQDYHLDTYLGGISDLEAFKQVGLDAQIQYFQDMGQFWLADVDSSQVQHVRLARRGGSHRSSTPTIAVSHHTITRPRARSPTRPRATARRPGSPNTSSSTTTTSSSSSKYMPVPAARSRADRERWDADRRCRASCAASCGATRPAAGSTPPASTTSQELILRRHSTSPTGSTSSCNPARQEAALHRAMKGAKFDLIETGGGAGLVDPHLAQLSTPNSACPTTGRCTTRSTRWASTIAYHTCGGTREIEDLIVANGCDASETLAPELIGGNQEPWEFKRQDRRPPRP